MPSHCAVSMTKARPARVSGRPDASAGTFAALPDLRIADIDMDAQMDEARIERIARAMCRSARRNPDERLPAPQPARPGLTTAFSLSSLTVPAWMQFRDSAERFLATQGD